MFQDRQKNLFFGEQTPGAEHVLFFLAVFVLWTVASGFFLFWSLQRKDELLLDTARTQARTSIEKDILYRRWNAGLGGVYGPSGPALAPNPYLDGADRDIQAGNGVLLTKVNPAYMTRQVHELGKSVFGIEGHITSLKPIRPENKADEWEARMLARLEESGAAEISGVQVVDGREYLRMMISLVTEEGCLKCHARQGYKLGDIRGGISVSVPLEPIVAADTLNRRIFTLVTVLAWMLGSLMIYSVFGIKKAEVSARINERRYRTLVETMSEGMIYLNGESRIVFCNPPFAHMLGYGQEDLHGKNFQSLMSEGSSGEYARMVEGITEGKLDSFELLLKTRNGGDISVLFSSRLLRSHLCEVVGLLGVTTDISRYKRMELEMQRQQRMISVGMLAGGIAHEVGAPLQYLEVNSVFLRRAFDSLCRLSADMQALVNEENHDRESGFRRKEHEMARLLEEIRAVLDENDSSILRISDITSSIKDLAGTGPVNAQPEDLNSLIRQCVEITRTSWSAVADMDLDLAPGIPEVDCIARDINQVLITVIMNAVDAISSFRESSQERDKGTIRIASGRIGGEVRIVVSDNGEGLPADGLEKVFEPFFTTKKPGKGTGQGLAVAQRIMHDHHGDIYAENLSGRGAVFIMILPV